jgi:hypothetical protein
MGAWFENLHRKFAIENKELKNLIVNMVNN